MDYWVIYLFVKLDDIKNYLTPEGGLVMLGIGHLVIFIIARALTNGIEDPGEAFIEAFDSAKWPKRLCIAAFVYQFVFGALLAAVPSTGQMAAIYLGGKASQSETADTLSRLPSKYASILEAKADEWLSQQDIGSIADKAVEVVGEKVAEKLDNP
jgi:hypothetical protein